MANKPKNRYDNVDFDAVARARELGREESGMEIENLKKKLQASELLFMTAGQVQTLNFTRAQAEFFMIVKLMQIKKTREYWEKYAMTWEQFCKYCGVEMVTVDRKIKELGKLREDWLVNLTSVAGVTFNKIKYLGMPIDDLTCQNDKSAVDFKGDDLYFCGEKVPMEAEAINAVLDRLEIAYKDRLDDQRKQAEKEKSALNEQISEANKDITVFKNEVERLRAFEPKSADEDITGKLNAVEGHLAQVDNLMRSFVFTTSDLSDETFGRVAGICERIRNRWEMFQTEFYELKEVQ